MNDRFITGVTLPRATTPLLLTRPNPLPKHGLGTDDVDQTYETALVRSGRGVTRFDTVHHSCYKLTAQTT
jgi:hypothetical protein